ncbi:rRNA maturation RNase YbeY [Desulfovibrio oxamicus]|uniref:Endoribonuclease YbeY n=1 Tax=Nitratidesulfovibrio oxamicus TaxID=32016 RepID=A0ABS0J8D0_9BACT|nr:rRNA maturation RNase YbeY [Nitratidesulfovibrio oxamicus]MBG3878715.1 rRNA maturation RNase YbeY [Nitratidesulfovibrio oxamicus]
MLVLRRAPGMGWMLPLAPGELRAVFAAMQEATGLAGCTVELDLVGDEEIARLNAAHLGCTGPTNILSFPAQDGYVAPNDFTCEGAADGLDAGPDAGPGDDDEPDDSPCHLGWLVLSLDTWRRECLLYGQEPVEHALRLLAHGLGHLAGYDHGPEMDAFTDAALEAGRDATLAVLPAQA